MYYMSEEQQQAVKAITPHLVNSLYIPGDTRQIHIADIRRTKKKVSHEMKSLLKIPENQNRPLSNLENKCFDALSEAIDYFNQKIEFKESFEENQNDLKRESSSNSASVFGKNEKVAVKKHNYKGMSIGSIMRTMAMGAKSEIEIKAMQEGVDSAGGFTVPIELMRDFIDLLRSKSVTQNAGAITVLLNTEKTSIARLASDPVASWRNELGNVAISDPTFDQVQFTARSLAVLVKVSRELLEDSLNVEIALMNALAKSLALEIDRVSLFGTGSDPEPLGISNTPGVLNVDMGINGSAITNYAEFILALKKLAETNSPSPTAAISAPRTRFTYAGFTDTTGQPLRAPDVVNEVAQMDTTAVPIDDSHGTANDASKIIVGDFTQLLLGIRSGLRIEILREKFSDTMEVGFLAHLRMDTAVAHPESFCVIQGVTP